MTRTAAVLIALLALGVANAMVKVEKIQPSETLTDLATADVDGNAMFSPPELVRRSHARDGKFTCHMACLFRGFLLYSFVAGGEVSLDLLADVIHGAEV